MNARDESSVRAKGGKNILVPAVTFLILVGLILIALSVVLQKKKTDIRRDSTNAAQQAALSLETFFSSRLAIVDHIRDEWLAGKVYDQKTFTGEAQRAQRQFPGVDGITRLDAEGVIRWVWPEAKYRKVIGRQVRNRPIPRAVFDKAKQTGEIQATSPIELVNGGKGMIVHFPLKRANRFDGSIGAVFRISDLIKKALRASLKESYFFIVADGETQVYTHGPVPADDVYSATHKIAVLDRKWAITLFPTKARIASRAWEFGWAVVTSGILLSGILCWLLFLYLSRQAALKESEERLRGIGQSAVDRFWETDENHRFSFVATFSQKVGLHEETEMIGKTLLELDSGHNKKGLLVLQEHQEKHLPFRNHTITRVDAEGRTNYFRLTGAPMFDADGNFKGYRGTTVDETNEVEARKKSEEQMKTVQARFLEAFDSISVAIDFYDAEDRLILSNAGPNRFYSMTQDLFVPGKTFETIVRESMEHGHIPAMKEQPEEWIRKRLEQHRNKKGVTEYMLSDGRWIQINDYQTHDSGTLVIHTDITERKQAEENQTRFIQALDGAPEGIILWDAQDRFVMSNERYRELQPMAADLLRPGMTYEEFFRERLKRGEIPRAQGRESEWIAELLEKHRQEFREIESLRHNRWLRIRENKLADGSTIAFVADITEKKQAEEDIRANEERYRDLYDNAPVAYTSVSVRDGSLLRSNTAFSEMLGYDKAELKHIKVLDLYADTPDGLPKAKRLFEHIQSGNHIMGEELQMKCKDGTSIWTTLRATPVMDGEGSIIETRSTMVDITERKRAEEKINASLAEKEVMLQEIHHRVKNNFQVIGSMLSLQAGKSKNEQVKEVLWDSRQRINAMARAHEYLYSSENLASISAKEYLTSIIEDINLTGGLEAHSVSLSLDIEDLALDGDQAVSCGQIVIELLSNAMKHAFPNGRSGTIDVSMRRREDGMIELVVTDDGVGLPEDFELLRSQTLGLRLVDGFTGKLQGEVTVDGKGGAHFRIVFPEKA